MPFCAVFKDLLFFERHSGDPVQSGKPFLKFGHRLGKPLKLRIGNLVAAFKKDFKHINAGLIPLQQLDGVHQTDCRVLLKPMLGLFIQKTSRQPICSAADNQNQTHR